MTIRRRLLAILASAVLAVAPILATPLAWAPVSAVTLVLVAGSADDAWARAGGRSGRSSGGYSRPSAPRTPSFAPSPSAPRTPSNSGGYARPGSAPAPAPFIGAAPSAGDQAISRQRAAEALQQQRTQEQRRQEAARPPPPPSAAPAPTSGGGWLGGGSTGGGWAGADRRTPSSAPPAPPQSRGWFAQQGWTPPAYAAAAPRSFGIFDGLLLWFMLDNLTKPGYTDFFRGRRDDPGVQQWRQHADEMARDNTDLRRKLAELDSRTAPGTGGGDSCWVEVPSDIPATVALADAGRARTPSTAPTAGSEQGGGIGLVVVIVVLAAAGGLAYMALRRRRASLRDTAMNPLQAAAAMARNAVAKKPYIASHFRVGMVLTADLSPFILAAGATKVVPPDASAQGQISVAAVGRLDAAGLVRLHLDDRKGMFQLHLDDKGAPDECRYFTLIDEVAPADAAEWEVWLGPAEGMIGWPEFQTKDGAVYQRVWSPGPGRIAPMPFEEVIATASDRRGEATETIRQQAMLYGAATGLAAPAPTVEYILVSAIERGGQAWVELRAGIDINPATLELT